VHRFASSEYSGPGDEIFLKKQGWRIGIGGAAGELDETSWSSCLTFPRKKGGEGFKCRIKAKDTPRGLWPVQGRCAGGGFLTLEQHLTKKSIRSFQIIGERKRKESPTAAVQKYSRKACGTRGDTTIPADLMSYFYFRKPWRLGEIPIRQLKGSAPKLTPGLIGSKIRRDMNRMFAAFEKMGKDQEVKKSGLSSAGSNHENTGEFSRSVRLGKERRKKDRSGAAATSFPAAKRGGKGGGF